MAAYHKVATTYRMEEFWAKAIVSPRETAEQLEETFQETFKRLLDVFQGIERETAEVKMPPMFDPDEIEKAGDKSLDRIIDHFLQREDILHRHTERQEDIWQDFYDKLEEIEIDYQRRVEDILIDIERQRQKAIRDFEYERRKVRREFQKEERDDLDKHLMDMRHRREMFRLREINNEAMYLYERSLLIAEGDVLALEELDARYKLQKEAREKEFDLEQRQREEKYQLRKRQDREDYEDEINDLRDALERKLREIDIREQERLEDAKRRRIRDREDAIRNREQMLRDEEKFLDRSLKQWAQYWENLSRNTKVGSKKITQILRSYFGPGGEADEIIAEFAARVRTVSDIRRRGGWGGGSKPIGGRVPQRRQFGGMFMANQDTLLQIGERQPELLAAVPLSPLGGVINLRWEGGAIPIQGSGLGGADLSGIGDAIAQGLVVELGRQLTGRGQ